LLRKGEEILVLAARDKKIALIVPGDPLSATTHLAIVGLAKEHDVSVEIIHNASILTAVAETGLSIYKFGRVATLPFSLGDDVHTSPYEQMMSNMQAGLHTLVLFDLDPQEKRFMTVKEAIGILRKSEQQKQTGLLSEDKLIIACAALGTPEKLIIVGTPTDLERMEINPVPRCLVIPGEMAHYEKEALEVLKRA